ncbi:MAG TPA: hypothetical protein VMS65_15025, partial [Polyangiaceae bacterium]|nr:hypothetical protein [Polyangiaceae bacterium]
MLGSIPLSAPHELRNWSWIATDGKEVRGEEAELVLDLKNGVLPPTTLVWQKTWLEWLPAHSVAELASAVPKEDLHPPVEPKRSPMALLAPLRPGIAALPKTAALPGAPPPVIKGADPSSFGMLGRPRGPSVLGPPRTDTAQNTAPPRAPMATLGDEPGEQRATLRPPGAIPPPPRQVPTPNFDLTPARLRQELEPPTRRRNPAPSTAAKDTLPDPRAPASAQPSELRPAVVFPQTLGRIEILAPKAAPLPKPAGTLDFDETLGSTPFEVTAQDFVDLPPPSTTLESTTPAPRVRTEPPRRKRSSGKPSLGGIAVIATLVGLATFVVAKFLGRSPAEVPKQAAHPASAEPAPVTTPAPNGCGIVQPASRLATSVHRPVAPLVTAPMDGTRASIGFAESETVAIGLSVDLVTLDVERVFEHAAKTPVRFVVPRALDSKRFLVDRDDDKLLGARSFDVEPRFSLGPVERDWVRLAGRSRGVV